MSNNYPPKQPIVSDKSRQSDNEQVHDECQSFTENYIPYQSPTHDQPIYVKKRNTGLLILISCLIVILIGVIGVLAYVLYDNNKDEQQRNAYNKETSVEKKDQEENEESFDTDKRTKNSLDDETEEEKLEKEKAKKEQKKEIEEERKKAKPVSPASPVYTVYRSDASWTNAYTYSGGNLVSIDSYDEFTKVCNLASANNLYVFWVSPNSSYRKWYPNEPSYYNEYGERENYLMVFKVNGSWYFNDSVNDVSSYYSGKMGYITEE